MPAKNLIALCVGVISCLVLWPAAAGGVEIPLVVQCQPSEVIAGIAKEKFGQSPGAQGITYGGALAQLLIAPDGKWSWVAVMPNGLTCVLTDGTDWQELVPAPVGEPS